MKKNYKQSHPWIDFNLNIKQFPDNFWFDLGECISKFDHLNRTAMSGDLQSYIYRLYLTKGAAATTAIEGNTLTEEEVKNILDGNFQTPLEDFQSQEIQIKNVLALYEKIVSDYRQQASLVPLTFDKLNEFQYKILKDLPIEGNIGRIRERSVVVAGYRGAPYEECEELLKELCKWLSNASVFKEIENKFGKKATAIIRSALVHLYIAWIHPYDDGNGRTARMAEFYCLIAAGIPAKSAHLSSNHCNRLRDQYYSKLRLSSINSTPIDFICFIVKGLKDGLREQLTYIYDENKRLVWRDYTEKKITGFEVARERRIQLARLMGEKKTSHTATQLLHDPTIATLYPRDMKKSIGLINNDLIELSKIEILEKQAGGYKAKIELLQGEANINKNSNQ